jgi:hypothetical protein
MKIILQNIQDRILAEITELQYVDEDWGQLNMYQPPVKWPCCLIDISTVNYTNLGIDRSKNPQNRQNGMITVKFTLANLKLTHTSGKAPQLQKDRAWFIWDLSEKLHEKIHGFSPGENCSKMLRSNLQKSVRDDGVQEYFITYNFEATNV